MSTNDTWQPNIKVKAKHSTSLPEVRRIKIVSLGSLGVGKTCLIKRYCEDRFVSKYMSTIGIDYGVKQVTVNGKEVKVNFWDLSGHEEFVEIRNEFYKDTQGILLVYDVNSRKSFEQLDDWMKEAQKYGVAQGGQPIIYVIGNKVDLKRRAVADKEAKDWATASGYIFGEVSAATGYGVKEVFDKLFFTIVENSLEK